jgi:hypothetical protein
VSLPLGSPLGVHPRNPRWLAGADGRALVLAGSHHWDVLVDNDERPGGLDFERFLDRFTALGHNCLRLWALESWLRPVRPSPWPRLGPGLARDRAPRFALSRHDPAYFARLRERVAAAGERGVAVVVMLFNGWSLVDKGEGDPWPHHPFHRDNNVDGIDGDPDREGHGLLVQTLRLPGVLRVQERYLLAVVEAVGDLPHVLWEVANEADPCSWDWQLHMLRLLRALDAERGTRHLAGLTAQFPGGSNAQLLASDADWISPGRRGGWMRSPPPGDGRKLVLLDSDHLWGIGGDAAWVWKAFTRGHHVLYMDPLDDDPAREAARRALGEVARLAATLDLAPLVPAPARASSRYALAAPGGAPAVVLLPRGGGVRVDLRGVSGALRLRWHRVGETGWDGGGPVTAGRWVRCRAPFPGPAVLVVEGTAAG